MKVVRHPVVGLFPALLCVDDREVDELAGGLLGREVSSRFDRLSDLPVQRLDRVGIQYERRCAWLTGRRSAGRLRASGTGALGATQDGQAALAGWAASPC